MVANVFNIQRFSVHDGDGIRTTIFFSGCPLHCLWCHNPEGVPMTPSLLFHSEKCVSCGKCIAVCPQKAITLHPDKASVTEDFDACIACGKCVPVCIADARAVAGKPYTVEELVKICVSDRMFYEDSGGGVTLSGGEVMAQELDFLLELLRALRNEDISVNIDTSGYVQYNKLEAVIPFVDTFLYDIKSAASTKHKYFTGVDNDLISENLRRLSDSGAKIAVRVPVIAPGDDPDGFDGANYTDSDIDGLISMLSGIRYKRVHLLPYHNTGKYKRVSLGQSVTDRFSTPSHEHLTKIKSRLEKAGVSPVVIGG